MRYKTLGKTKEKLPVMGLGTWQMGRDDKGEVAALKKGLAMGARFIDTAEIYGSEPLVGKALKGEKDVFVATKVWPQHLRYDDVIKACNNSLTALGVKTIDLYQIHWPNHRVPIEETMHAMEKLVKDGKIRHIGLSNFSVGEMVEAQEALKANEIASNQIEYSVITRDAEKELVGYCERERITVIAYSPLGHGLLYEEKFAPLVQLLTEIGKKHDATATQVALAWLLREKPVVAIPKASSVSHTVENVTAADLTLNRTELSRIEEASRRYTKAPLAREPFATLLKHTTFWHSLGGKRLGGSSAKKR